MERALRRPFCFFAIFVFLGEYSPILFEELVVCGKIRRFLIYTLKVDVSQENVGLIWVC